MTTSPTIVAVLDVITNHPGLHARDITQRSGKDPRIVQAVLSKLARDGRVRREGKRREYTYHPGAALPMKLGGGILYGGIPQKGDMMQLHATLYAMRRILEEQGLVKEDAFEAYDAFGVTPLSLHQTRRAHHRAVILLGEALDRAVRPREERRFRL